MWQRVQEFESNRIGGPSEISLEIETPGGLIREYRGTADVWNWYRATTVGAYPAMSSLMALRQWALSEITHRSVDSVVGEIMACGTSLAFASVAYSVAIENLEDARQIIYSYFRHPLIWHLEIGRVVHENSPLAPPLSEGSFLRHLPEQIAALLMLTGDSAARNEMKVVGDDLMLRHRELLLEPTSAGQAEGAVSEAVLLTTRWASSLDFERYQFSETDDDHSIVTIGVPDDVRIGLEQSGGEEAQLWLELHALSFLVCSQRDAFANSDFSVEAAQSAVERIGELSTLLEGRPGGQRPWIEEAAAGAAAVVVLQAAAGREVGDEELQRSSRRLMELSLTLESMSDSYDNVDSQAWIFGSDRSMAAAIPSLLSPRLRERTGHSLDEVRQSLTVIASSPFFEVLERLCKALANQWRELPSVNSAREVIVEVLYEVVATSGLGPWINNERHRIRLLDPIGDITRSNEHNLNLTRARYAISSLEAIADSGQQYCDRASDLLNALVIHDRAVWPEHISNHDYIYVDGWRKDIDSVIAERAAKWNAHDLFAHVSAFISVPHDLVGLLTELNSKSDTLDRANAVHDVWPTLLDQLLPKARSANGETRNRHRRSSSLEELDRALLLAPIEHVEWPWNRTFALIEKMDCFFSRLAASGRSLDGGVGRSGTPLHGIRNDCRVGGSRR
jgi:hypothetical protein